MTILSQFFFIIRDHFQDMLRIQNIITNSRKKNNDIRFQEKQILLGKILQILCGK